MKHLRPILALYAICAATRILPNLATRYLISLDSWTIYHILEAILNGHALLPRSQLYSYYPLSYLPLLPFAKVFGIMFALKFVYPLITSLAVIPLYHLMRRQLDGPKAFLASLTVISIDDFLFRSTAVTPQGIALISLFAAMCCLVSGNRKWFLIFGILTLATHHLTSLILMIFVAAYLVSLILERKSEEMDGSPLSDFKSLMRLAEAEKAPVAFIGLFFLSWFIVSNLAERNVLSIYMALKLLPSIAIVVAFLATLGPQLRLLGALERMRVEHLLLASAAVVASVFLFVTGYSTQSFLSTYSYLALLLMPAYVLAPVLAAPYLLRRRERLWLAFCAILFLTFILVIALRLNCVFDVYRLLPFFIFSAAIVLFKETGYVGHLLLLVVAISSVGHLAVSFDRLIYDDAQVGAAVWAGGNLPQATVATDTKMSALFEGLGRMPATFEGSYWLFTQDDLAPWIRTFNRYRFTDHPIRYIAVSGYMFERGADISWSSKDVVINMSNIRDYDEVGRVVYNNTDVVIWELNMSKVENTTDLKIVNTEKGFVDGLLARLLSSGGAQGGDGASVDSRIAYGTTC